MILQTEKDKIAHLLRRFGLGASEAEMEYYSQGGLKGAIDKLLNYESTPSGVDFSVEKFSNAQNQKLNMIGVQAWWVAKILGTRRPLEEKMTIFWHDHFATSAAKVVAPLLMEQQNEVLRANATGKFQDLLLAVSKDPAMLQWLDNQYNVKGKPNENFAREVMELFTLGIGNYSEKDIQESARAFTGWTFRRIKPADPVKAKGANAEFLFRPALHDSGTKTFLGKEGSFNGDDIIAILCSQPQTARFLTKKVWEWFVYLKPEDGVINKFATTFRNSGLDIKSLLRSIMESEEFYSDRAAYKTYKDPVNFAIPTLRQLGVGEDVAALIGGTESVVGVPRLAVGAAQQALKQMGMTLFFPPDVAGWDFGPAWITSATMVERIQWGERVFGQGGTQGRGAQIRYPAYPLLEANPTPEGVVAKLMSVFDAKLPKAKVDALVAAARTEIGAELTPQNAGKAAAKVSRLMFGTPEFQFC